MGKQAWRLSLGLPWHFPFSRGGDPHSGERGKAFWARRIVEQRQRKIQDLVFIFPPIFFSCVPASKAQEGLMKTTLRGLTVKAETSQSHMTLILNQVLDVLARTLFSLSQSDKLQTKPGTVCLVESVVSKPASHTRTPGNATATNTIRHRLPTLDQEWAVVTVSTLLGVGF